MEFSYRWLSDYVDLPGVEEAAARLTAAGFAVELIEPRGEDDFVFDVDVTTNRVDAMNHLGLAREASVLFESPLRTPSVDQSSSAERADSVVTVSIEAPEHCGRYVAKVIRGVTVAPSPSWLRERLEAIGVGRSTTWWTSPTSCSGKPANRCMLSIWRPYRAPGSWCAERSRGRS